MAGTNPCEGHIYNNDRYVQYRYTDIYPYRYRQVKYLLPQFTNLCFLLYLFLIIQAASSPTQYIFQRKYLCPHENTKQTSTSRKNNKLPYFWTRWWWLYSKGFTHSPWVDRRVLHLWKNHLVFKVVTNQRSDRVSSKTDAAGGVQVPSVCVCVRT